MVSKSAKTLAGVGPQHLSPVSNGLKVLENAGRRGPPAREPSLKGSQGHGYKVALKNHGLNALLGDDASIQPGQLQELMLHETAVSWMRERLKQTVPKKAREETVDAHRSRLKACAAHINAKHDVKALCKEFPGRLAELSNRRGDRLGK